MSTSDGSASQQRSVRSSRVTRRLERPDIQEHELRGLLGPAKGKDTATSFSRYLVTPDELEPYREGNAYALEMTAELNGKPYSSGTFSTIYWTFGQLLAYASGGTVLRRGDVIGSGTVGTGCILSAQP